MNIGIKNILSCVFTNIPGRFLVLMIFISPVLIFIDYAHAEKSVCEFQNRECFTEAGYPACYNKIDVQKYYQFTEKGQTELAEQIVSDDTRCIKLNGNEKAAMMDKSSGFVKFTLRGTSKTLWAKREALYAN